MASRLLVGIYNGFMSNQHHFLTKLYSAYITVQNQINTMLSSKTIQRESGAGSTTYHHFHTKVCRRDNVFLPSKLSGCFDRVKCESGAGSL